MNPRVQTGSGVRDFGDWDYSSRYLRGWGNIEYDRPYACFLQVPRWADLKYFGEGEIEARHYMDIDRIHIRTNEYLLGAPHIQSTDHTTGGNDLGHTWLRGLVYYHCLTGDAWSMEVARGMAGFCVRASERTDFRDLQERCIGWMLIALSEI